MEQSERKQHWERVYETKDLTEVSWYQPFPEASIGFLEKFNLPKTAGIIDVGGGDSLLVDFLLERGFTNVTVLDISEKALERAKVRLGEKAALVKWIVADAASFTPEEHYDLWHDRAAFHFLTEENEVRGYVNNVWRFVKAGGYLVLGTFSENGPEKCSGLPVRRYSETTMTARLKGIFKKIKCITTDHITPAKKIQNFVFCSFQRLKVA